MASGQTWLLVAAGENWQIELVEAVKAEVKSRKLKKLSLMIMTSRFFSFRNRRGMNKKSSKMGQLINYLPREQSLETFGSIQKSVL